MPKFERPIIIPKGRVFEQYRTLTPEEEAGLQGRERSPDASSRPESPLERTLRLREQYESQRLVLDTAGLLETDPRGHKGIKAIDGAFHSLPSYDAIQALMRENRDVLAAKAEQGFTKLLIVPFGLPLQKSIDAYGTLLKQHSAQKTLFAPKENPQDPDTPLTLDEATPVWVWDKYQNADTNGTLVYYPQRFDKANHGGRTKQEVIASDGAFQILMVEDLTHIPEKGTEKTLGGRPQLPVDKQNAMIATEYQALLGSRPPYTSEEGLTLESWITLALTNLTEKNQVTDDWRGKGKAPLLTGSFVSASGIVPVAYWIRDTRRAILDGCDPGVRDGAFGVRSAVRIKSCYWGFAIILFPCLCSFGFGGWSPFLK